MIKLENVVLASPEQMEFIIAGMRNPMNSWEKSDSGYGCDSGLCSGHCAFSPEWCGNTQRYVLGENDYTLMQKLSKAGTDHRKFMRMMPVYVRITAPLYWWKEFDTYKVGTVANSCSTMHKIAEKEFELEDFSTDKIIDAGEPEYEDMYDDIVLNLHFDFDNQYYDPHDIFGEILLPALNLYREKYIKTKDKNTGGRRFNFFRAAIIRLVMRCWRIFITVGRIISLTSGESSVSGLRLYHIRN